MHDLQPGDHVKVNRGLYEHHGIYVGHNKVIHYNGAPSNMKNAYIEETSINRFTMGSKIQVVRSINTNNRRDIVKNAYSRLGERQYDLIFNNCEHFAEWCKSGRSKSKQVKQYSAFATKAAITTSTKIATKTLVRGTTKGITTNALRTAASPMLLAADVIEYGTSYIATKAGMNAENAAEIGETAGFTSAVTIGFATGGFVGAAVGAAVHTIGSFVGDWLAGE